MEADLGVYHTTLTIRTSPFPSFRFRKAFCIGLRKNPADSRLCPSGFGTRIPSRPRFKELVGKFSDKLKASEKIAGKAQGKVGQIKKVPGD
jgi:hypothetical protein